MSQIVLYQAVNLVNGKRYRSMTVAANEFGLTKNSIWMVCQGKRNLTKGLSFQYAEDR